MKIFLSCKVKAWVWPGSTQLLQCGVLIKNCIHWTPDSGEQCATILTCKTMLYNIWRKSLLDSFLGCGNWLTIVLPIKNLAINTRCKTECFNFSLDLVSALCFSEYCENKQCESMSKLWNTSGDTRTAGNSRSWEWRIHWHCYLHQKWMILILPHYTFCSIGTFRDYREAEPWPVPAAAKCPLGRRPSEELRWQWQSVNVSTCRTRVKRHVEARAPVTMWGWGPMSPPRLCSVSCSGPRRATAAPAAWWSSAARSRGWKVREI